MTIKRKRKTKLYLVSIAPKSDMEDEWEIRATNKKEARKKAMKKMRDEGTFLDWDIVDIEEIKGMI